MELNIKEPRDLEELRKATQNMDSIPEDISIRIENNILTIDGKWLLRERDGKFENINVLLGQDKDNTQNFRSELRKQIEGFKGRWDVDTKKLLYARLDKPNLSGDKPCLTLSYLSVLETGNSADIEAWKQEGFIWQDIGKVDRTQLTFDTSYTYGVMRQNEQEIQNLLKQYTEFDEKKFDQYFLHGMENRYDLLEGIIYYTNCNLTNKYLELASGENFPTKEEKIKIWKREIAKNYEQLYRFIYVLDGEDNRFNYSLRNEEKTNINEMIEEILQRLQGKNKNQNEQSEENEDEKGVLLFFKRGIFFNDRLNDEARKKGLTYDKVRGYTWTEEIYRVLQQLKYMERLDPYQYYSRWLQAKIGRLDASKKYKREDLEELKKVYRTYFEIKEQKKNTKVEEKA